MTQTPEDREIACDECGGTGKVRSVIQPFEEYNCPICGGSGRLILEEGTSR